MSSSAQYRRSQRLLGGLGLLWFVLAGTILYFEFLKTPSIRITWATETEFDTAGFNIYRGESADGEFIQVNEQLIPSQAEPSSGAEYEFIDRQVERGKTYFYRLEDVEYSNRREQHDIATSQAAAFEPLSLVLALASILVGLFLLYNAFKSEVTYEQAADSQAGA